MFGQQESPSRKIALLNLAPCPLYEGKRKRAMKNYKYWIALEQVQGIGPANLKLIYETLRDRGLTIIDIFSLSREEITGEFSFSEKVADAVITAGNALSRVEGDYFTLLDNGIEPILFFEESYPARLHEQLKNAFPPVLYSFGNRALLLEKGAAILGDRDVSDKGELIGYLAARELVKHRFCVISGFARGVDMIAHRAALENRGKTIAILPCGMNHLKIPEFIREVFLPENILFLSPFYPPREYSVYNAYARNRIICALSHAVYIVESPPEGGIFEAAKSAQGLGVPLFVTEYSRYPDSALGNKKIIDELGGYPVKGRMEDNLLVPNLDRMIGSIRFPEQQKEG